MSYLESLCSIQAIRKQKNEIDMSNMLDIIDYNHQEHK
jgi:hypothetical protein